MRKPKLELGRVLLPHELRELRYGDTLLVSITDQEHDGMVRTNAIIKTVLEVDNSQVVMGNWEPKDENKPSQLILIPNFHQPLDSKYHMFDPNSSRMYAPITESEMSVCQYRKLYTPEEYLEPVPDFEEEEDLKGMTEPLEDNVKRDAATPNQEYASSLKEAEMRDLVRYINTNDHISFQRINHVAAEEHPKLGMTHIFTLDHEGDQLEVIFTKDKEGVEGTLETWECHDVTDPKGVLSNWLSQIIEDRYNKWGIFEE